MKMKRLKGQRAGQRASMPGPTGAPSGIIDGVPGKEPPQRHAKASRRSVPGMRKKLGY